jgi:PAS domain S-box-containing protein
VCRRSRLLFSAVEQSSEGIAVSDLAENLQFVNQAIAQMVGYCRSELESKSIAMIQSPNAGRNHLIDVQSEVLLNSHFFGEFEHQRKHGEEFNSEAHISLLRNEEGIPSGSTRLWPTRCWQQLAF